MFSFRSAFGTLAALFALAGCGGAGLSGTPSPVVPQTPGDVQGSGQMPASRESPADVTPGDSSAGDDVPITKPDGPTAAPSQRPTVKPSGVPSTHPTNLPASAKSKKASSSQAAASAKKKHRAHAVHVPAKKKAKPKLSGTPS